MWVWDRGRAVCSLKAAQKPWIPARAFKGRGDQPEVQIQVHDHGSSLLSPAAVKTC